MECKWRQRIIRVAVDGARLIGCRSAQDDWKKADWINKLSSRGNWTVRCALLNAAKRCEMVQTTEVKGRNRPLTEIAIGRPANGGPLKIIFQVPINVWLPPGVKLTTANNVTAITASFGRCVPAGCLAETDMTAKTINVLRALKKNGALKYQNAGKREVDIPVSFNGFGDAFDAMPN